MDDLNYKFFNFPQYYRQTCGRPALVVHLVRRKWNFWGVFLCCGTRLEFLSEETASVYSDRGEEQA